MINAQLFGFSLFEIADWPRIPSISDIDHLWSDKTNVGSTSRVWLCRIAISIPFFSHLVLNLYDLFLALRTQQQLIYLQKGLFQSHIVFLSFVTFIFLELLYKVAFCKGWNLGSYVYIMLTSVAVEHCKQEMFLVSHVPGNVSVFHVLSPAWMNWNVPHMLVAA